jgi:hypothetical protein
MTSLLPMALVQSDQGMMGTGGTLVHLAVLVLILAVWWKVFVKAGKPGWGGHRAHL